METEYRLAPGVNWREFNNGVIIEPGMALNETGAIAFRLAVDGASLGVISDLISKEYSADKAQIRSDIEELFTDLVGSGIFTIIKPDAA